MCCVCSSLCTETRIVETTTSGYSVNYDKTLDQTCSSVSPPFLLSLSLSLLLCGWFEASLVQAQCEDNAACIAEFVYIID